MDRGNIAKGNNAISQITSKRGGFLLCRKRKCIQAEGDCLYGWKGGVNPCLLLSDSYDCQYYLHFY